VTASSIAWETDNFTSRRKILKASEEEKNSNLFNLNDEMNKKMLQVIEGVNDDYDCQEDMARIKKGKVPRIYSHIDDVLGGTHAAIEEFAEEGGAKLYDHSRAWLAKENIYSKNYGLQGSFNLNGHVIGPDKLGHFVDQGFDLMEVMIEKGINKEGFFASMEESNDLENGFYGISSSGVKSYGDMAANFSGLSFYYNLLFGANPQLKCDSRTKKYTMDYDFDWSDYVDDSWDEGVNCSFFYKVDNPFTGRTSRFNIKKTDEGDHLQKYLQGLRPPMACPSELNKCKTVSKRNCANYFTSPQCLRKVVTYNKCRVNSLTSVLKVTRNTNSPYKYNRDQSNGGSHESNSLFNK